MLSFFKKKDENIVSGSCLQCGRCCQNLILFSKGKPVKTLEHFEKLKKRNPFYQHFNLIYKNKTNGFLYFSCSKQGSDGSCTVYENRPSICKNYPRSKMFKNGGNLLPGCGYEVSSPPGKFQKILKKKMKGK